MLDLHRLRLLRELKHRGTLAAVAEALSYSPSSISQQLSVLEKEAGVPLLEPVGRRVRLTAQAEILVAHTEAVLERLEQAETDLAASLRGITGVLRVAAFQTAALALVPDALSLLRDAHPRLRVEITQREPESALPALLARDFDLVITEEYPGDPIPRPAGVEYTPLGEDELHLALPTPQAQHAAKTQGVPETHSAAEAQRATDAHGGAGTQRAANAQPAAETQPGAETQHEANAQPATKTQRGTKTQRRANAQPARETQRGTETQGVPVVPSAVEAQSAEARSAVGARGGSEGWAAEGWAALRDLAGRPWVMEPDGTASRRWATRLCREAGFEPDVRFESTDLLLHLRLVERGHAAALLPGLVWPGRPPTVPVVRLPEAHRVRRLFTASRRGGGGHPAVRAFRDALASGFAEPK